MKNTVIDQNAVLEALQDHPGEAFELLKKSFMKMALRTALDQNGGNIMAAARQLGITRNTMYIWLEK